jgi:hypothetical protein
MFSRGTRTSAGQRQAWRYAVNGSLTYRDADGEDGKAQWRDVSATGARVHLGRYLCPGRTLGLTFNALALPGAEAGLSGAAFGGTLTGPATVVWCRQSQDTVEFDAGVVFPVEEEFSGFARTVLLDFALYQQEEYTPFDGAWSHGGLRILKPGDSSMVA